MTDFLFGTILFLAIVIGWVLGKFESKKKSPPIDGNTVPREYFRGLNLLLDDRQDEAIEVFMRSLEATSDTLETYLVMGRLFRRRGEVDRAIGVHQELLNNQSLSSVQEAMVQFELARDYLKAGVLDRSESILQMLVSNATAYAESSLKSLLIIYEQEKSWEDAIKTGDLLDKKGQSDVRRQLAHYHCELAEESIGLQAIDNARRELTNALRWDKRCVRASLLQGQLEFDAGEYQKAIRSLRRIRHQDEDFLPEALPLLEKSYHAIHQEEECINYLFTVLEQHPAISIVIALSDKLQERKGDVEGAYVLSEYLKQRPSVRGLHRLIDFHLSNSEGPAKENLALLQAFTQQMIDNKPVYQCQACGFGGKILYWHCPTCQKWGTVKPIHGLEGE